MNVHVHTHTRCTHAYAHAHLWKFARTRTWRHDYMLFFRNVRIMCMYSYTYVCWIRVYILSLQIVVARMNESHSDPDSKQKLETELTFWYVLPYFVHSEPFQLKQKQKQVCTSHIWICDHLWHLWPKVTKSVLLTKLEKTRVTEVTTSKLLHFVTVTNVTHECDW